MQLVGVSRENSKQFKTLTFILLSLFLHAMLLLFPHRWFADFYTSSSAPKPLDIEMIEMSKQDLDKLKSQIVETTLTEKSDEAAKDAYLGMQTQTVARQTRAKNTAAFHEGQQASQNQAQPHKQEPVSVGALGVKMNLKPMGSLGPTGQAASNSDYLNEVKPGAQTLLNTREYAYFSFYQRVRRQLEQYWEPGLRNRLRQMFEKGRRLAADREHATRVLVVMDFEGTITKIQVEGTSGLFDLDQAAIDAFNKAGPFPNPPKGMMEKDGTVKVEWEFVLKT